MVELAFHSLHFSPMFGGPGRPLEQVVAAAGAAGFAALGLDRPAIEAFRARGGTVAGLAGELRRSGVRCCDILPFFADPAAGAAETRRRAAALGELATALGAPVVIASAPGELPESEQIPLFSQAAQVLAPLGIRLALEYIPHSSLRTLAAAARICDTIGWDRAGLAVDSFHSCLGGASLDQIAALAPGQIAIVQYSDARTTTPADRVEESRHHRRLPGTGCLPLARWRAAVRATGYDGVVAAEVLSASLRDAPDLTAAIRACYHAMQADWETR